MCEAARAVSLAPLGCAAAVSQQSWSAHWISVPGAPPSEFGVYHFRRSLFLAAAPSRFQIRISADNRYQLFVNGVRAAWGPARGNLEHWRYETVDIARRLKAGRNVLVAVVWNDGPLAAQAQLTDQTVFLVQGASAVEQAVDTGESWKCIRNGACAPVPVSREEVPFPIAIGPGERVNGQLYPWGWEREDFDDSGWQAARPVAMAAPRGAARNRSRWMLVLRSIPMMEEGLERLVSLRRTEGVRVPDGFPREPVRFVIPARTSAALLLDQSSLTTAYPELVVSGGAGAIVKLRYAEALFDPNHRDKGHHDDIQGKRLFGNEDVFLPDGGAQRLFRPLWWRTYRYVEVKVETGPAPLTIEDFRAFCTRYPFTRKAEFDADLKEVASILETGWRTLRLCAHETFMDCPYYEQMQYAGDTRIQALASLYMSGDGRLMRNAIEQLNDSRTADGLTYSRAPSRRQQYIPPFSLWWIGMVHDYWMYLDDEEFVRRMLPGVRAVLSFFEDGRRRNGRLGHLPYWNFVDWAQGWGEDGVPPIAQDGSAALLDLQLLLAHQWAARMEAALGSTGLASDFRRAAERLSAEIRTQYWDSKRGLFADTSAKSVFSQHANALAVLADVPEPTHETSIVERTLSDSALTQCSIYFRHYLNAAMNRAGLGERYLDSLGAWRRMLALGLTTWAETEEPARSDCHAWGASPNFELFRTVLGIDSAAPAFRRVVIRPHLGPLKRVSGSIPHPKGELRGTLKVIGDSLDVHLRLPAEVSGQFHWQGQTRDLQPGETHFRLRLPRK